MLYLILKSIFPYFFFFSLAAHTVPLFYELQFFNLITNNPILNIELKKLSFLD